MAIPSKQVIEVTIAQLAKTLHVSRAAQQKSYDGTRQRTPVNKSLTDSTDSLSFLKAQSLNRRPTI